MERDCLIGVDVGTQGTKAAVYTCFGKPLANAFVPSRLISPAAGQVEQDPDEMVREFTTAVRLAVEESGIAPGAVAAIGLDGQMAGILGIDSEYNAVTHYDSWLDTRCAPYIGRIKRTAEERVVALTGCPVTVAHGPKMLWWKHERPEIYRRIAKFILPTAYIAGKLTGLKAGDAYIDYTDIHFSGFADVENMRWSEELLRRFDLDGGKLPDIVEPWKIIGKLTDDAAEQMGLASGIPVAAGCGDQAAASLGAGVTRAGLVFDVAGTASVFSCCVDRYRPDVANKTILFARSVLPGLWIPLAYISGGGLCLKWFRDSMMSGSAAYAQLDAEAAGVEPGSDDLFFLPHFNGRTCPNDPVLKGTWLGLDWSHGRGHLYRAIMESVAYEYGHYLKLMRGLLGDLPVSRVIAIGGGAKSKLFNAIKADVLGIPYAPQGTGDTATWGAAVVAGYGAGVFSDIPSAVSSAIGLDGETVEPDMENHRLYAGRVAAYESLFELLHRMYSKLSGGTE